MKQGDSFFEAIKVNKELATLIEKIERKVGYAVEAELRRILEQLRVKVNRDTTHEEVEARMKLMGIEIVYVQYTKLIDKKRQFNGWHIFQHKQPLLIIADPKIDCETGQIIIERIIPRDVGDAISLRSQ